MTLSYDYWKEREDKAREQTIRDEQKHASEIEEMGSQSGATYAKGIAIFDDGALYNNIYYSAAPAVFPKSGITTGIEDSISDSPNGQTNDGWYTLDGKKLSEKPTQKGIYIYNGRKVMIN